MRGRKPETLTIHSPDISELERIAHSDTSPWYQVRRARIVLGIAAGQRREDLATQLECDESTIWRSCQRYRDRGSAACLPIRGKATPDVTWGSRRCKGHRSLSWLAWSRGQRVAHHALVE